MGAKGFDMELGDLVVQRSEQTLRAQKAIIGDSTYVEDGIAELNAFANDSALALA